MNTKIVLIISMSLILSSCSNQDGEYDASGIFEATEVMVSAKNTGELKEFKIHEGQDLVAGKQIGYIDTLPLYLQKVQLLANMKAVDSRHYTIAKQIASLQQQIATQRNELIRFENLLKSNAANQKQVDDIHSQIAVLEKQLTAQTETLENNNQSLSAEALGLQAQIAQVEDQLRKSSIYSPIDGVVTSKYAEQGEFSMQGRSLFKVADLSDMNLRAYITADQLTNLKIGQTIKVFADQGKSNRKEYEGKLLWISDKAEFTPKSIQTREERANLVYAIKVGVKNDGLIKKGMYGEIKIY